MSMLDWAEKEIEIACKVERSENEDPNGTEWDYGVACYESALKAFRSLMEDSHSGASIHLTKHILVRLIEGKALTPIEDTEDIWEDISRVSGVKTREEHIYQCHRMSSLFKYVHADGSVKYKDVERCHKIDIHNGSSWHNGLVDKIVDEMYPITMPYYPGNSIKMYCEDFLADPKNGDYDTLGFLYLVTGDGREIEINRFFTEGEDEWREITQDEYIKLKDKSKLVLKKGDIGVQDNRCGR